MPKFTVYNYQFEKYLDTDKDPKFEFKDGTYKDPDAAFEHRQEIFSTLFPEVPAKVLPFEFWNGSKYHIHRLVLPPNHGLVVLRLSNKKKSHRTNEDLQQIDFDDYPCLYVIIDNRPGKQRILIEQKQSVFKKTETVAKILQNAFNKELLPHMLTVVLYSPFPSREFWKVVGKHKEGFRKVLFHLPHLNLDRLSKIVEKYLTDARRSFDSSLDFAFTATKGGKLELHEENELQRTLAKAVSATGQPMRKEDNPGIVLVTTGQHASYIKIGKDAHISTTIPQPTLNALKNDQLTIEGEERWDALEHKLDTLTDDN